MSGLTSRERMADTAYSFEVVTGFEKRKGASRPGPTDLGGVIRTVRRRLRLSVHDLSEETGISERTLGRIEDNRTSPTIRTLTAIAIAFRVPVSDLFTPEGERANRN